MHGPVTGDDDTITVLDLARAIIGYYDARTGKLIPGIKASIDTVAKELADFRGEAQARFALDRRIDSYILRAVLLIGCARFLGLDHISDLLKYLPHG